MNKTEKAVIFLSALSGSLAASAQDSCPFAHECTSPFLRDWFLARHSSGYECASPDPEDNPPVYDILTCSRSENDALYMFDVWDSDDRCTYTDPDGTVHQNLRWAVWREYVIAPPENEEVLIYDVTCKCQLATDAACAVTRVWQ